MRACIIDCTDDKFMTRGMTRRTSSSAYSTGMKCIEDDYLLKYGGNFIPKTSLDEIKRYDVAFLSLTSVQEVESFIKGVDKDDYRKNRCKIIAGGAGCINIYSIIDYIDIAVFGRCDNSQIIDILNGKYAENVWVKENDFECSGSYKVGEFKEPKKHFETGSIGCRRDCYYCQYTNVRTHDNKPYSPQKGAAETDIWASDFTTPRVYTTAIDGLTEKTRMMVNKPITDKYLVKKISSFYSEGNRNRTIGIKLYNIVGYPWETPETVENDFKTIVEMLSKIDRRTGKWRCNISFQNTPFSPEPLTPMQDCIVDVDMNFRKSLLYKYEGVDLRMRSTNFHQSGLTRAHRIAINRCEYKSRDDVRSFILDRKKIKDITHILTAQNPIKYLQHTKDHKNVDFSEYEKKRS